MCIRDRARNASTPPTPSRPARSSTSSTTSTAYCFSTGWPERTPSTPASATCSGRGAVVPTTLWYQQQHCGTNNTVVPNDDGGVAPVAQPAEAGVLNTLQLGFESLRGHCWGWLWTSRHTGTGLCVVLDTPAAAVRAGVSSTTHNPVPVCREVHNQPQQCPRRDSNPHWSVFKTPASAGWATGATPPSSLGTTVLLVPQCCCWYHSVVGTTAPRPLQVALAGVDGVRSGHPVEKQ